MSGSPARAAWSTADDGDLRGDPAARHRFARRVGAPLGWATVDQVHGGRVVDAASALAALARGDAEQADGIVVARPGEAAAVFTADCLGVVLVAEGGAAVAHAGWRGLLAGVLEAAVAELETIGGRVRRAILGPAIGPCCFEVGPEVLDRFDGAYRSTTTWGTPSVDLVQAAIARLGASGVPVVERLGTCTRCDDRYHSHRRDRTAARMATLVWLPPVGERFGEAVGEGDTAR